ncbi:hypothetical protein CWO89_20115 [Bradyrhizobium sp. Leo170]|nr:hypothetical protein CWO89_20115 [Bradyrhizobium sp. Leo170]
MGRPSVDPELMIRMLLVRYCFGIRHERGPRQEGHCTLLTAVPASSSGHAGIHESN